MAPHVRLAFLVILAVSSIAMISTAESATGKPRRARAVTPAKHLFIGEPTSPAALAKYYGKTSWQNSSAYAGQGKPHQLLVCGYHNTGTSIMTRLLMLMGVWAGYPNELWLSQTNPLKYFERKEVLKLEDTFVSPYSTLKVGSYKVARWLGAGFNASVVTPADVEKGQDTVQKIADKMGAHAPWVLKDPRLCLSSPLWLSVLKDPMCIIIYKNPREVAYRLSLHSIKSFQNINKEQKVESAPLHLEMWANYTLSGLQACRGRPTIIFPSTMLTSRATVEMAVMVLYEQLVAAGVPDVQLPTYELLFAEVLQYSMARKEDDDMRFDSGHRNPTISFDTELMTTGLLWTPDKPDSPWIEPTKPSWSRKIAALSGAVQQYLKVSYSKSQRIAPDRVADSILTYMDKLLAMKGDAAGAAEFGDKL